MRFLQPELVAPCDWPPELSMICPYCGVSTDVAHESQEGCIKALNAEITRMRDLLHHVRSVKVPEPVDLDREEERDPTARGPTKV